MSNTEKTDKALDDLAAQMEKSLLRRLRTFGGLVYEKLGKYELNQSLVVVLLAILRNKNGLEPAQISADVLIPRQTMTAILDNLERLGYIARFDHPSDRRRKIVRLTDAGTKKGQEIWNGLREMEEQVISVLTKEEFEQLTSINDKIANKLRELV